MAQKKTSKATITSVANLAGVSTATAGRVLGGYGYSSEEVRERVHASAAQLGYQPNQLARSLITGITKTIGVVAGDIQSPFYSSVLSGIYDVARAEGFGILLTGSDEIPEREVEAVQLLKEKQVDGLIVAPSQMADAAHLRAVLEADIPLVLIDRIVEGLDADAVLVDNVAASHRSTQALIEADHKRIGVVAELEWWHGGGLDEFIAGVVAGSVAPGHLFPSWQRLYGYMQAHIVAGLPIERCLVARVGSYSVEAAKTAIRDVLQDEAASPTAFFSADGLMSAAIMGVVKELGLSIPGDLSLVCFDDLDWMRFYQPAITAVLQPTRKMGETAARLVLDRIHGEPSPARREVLETTLIRRASIQPPASAG